MCMLQVVSSKIHHQDALGLDDAVNIPFKNLTRCRKCLQSQVRNSRYIFWCIMAAAAPAESIVSNESVKTVANFILLKIINPIG